MITALLVAGLIQSAVVRDSARLDGERLVVDPLGVSFLVPPVWLGLPVPKGRDYLCANHPTGTVADRIITERARFGSLRGPAGEWQTEFSAVIDSVLPFDNLVAHLGGDPWKGSCFAMQMRVYVGNRLARRTIGADPGIKAARHYFTPVRRTRVDSAGWSITRLGWNAYYYDYGGPARIEFWSRSVRGRDVVLVFMFQGDNAEQARDRNDIIESLRAS